jgi:hypothetical protein
MNNVKMHALIWCKSGSGRLARFMDHAWFHVVVAIKVQLKRSLKKGPFAHGIIATPPVFKNSGPLSSF